MGAASLDLLIIGANHRSAGSALRDRLFVEPDALPAAHDALRATGVDQALLLSTCARFEIQSMTADPEADAARMRSYLGRRAGGDETALADETYQLHGRDAVRHLFRIVSSLDSPIVGEPQVNGQVRDSHQMAREHGLLGSDLDTLLQAAYRTAKRVRNETPIGEKPVTIAQCALGIARDVHGDLARARGLLLAGGDMGELIAERVLDGGLGTLTVASPLDSRSAALARQLGCHHGMWSELDELMVEADIVIASLGTGSFPLAPETVETALTRRRRRPMLFIDAAIPRDVDPAAEDLDGAFVYTLDDLEAVVTRGRADRDRAAEDAAAIVEQEVDAWMARQALQDDPATLLALRDHFEQARIDVLADMRGADTEEVTRRLINRLLHNPTRWLAGPAADDGSGLGEAQSGIREKLVRDLFALGRSDKAGDEEEDR